MPVLRTKCVSTKVTADEYARLEALAGGQKVSEWAREVLLKGTTRQAAEQLILGELLALRMILVKLHFALATGETPTSDDLCALIDQADADKFRRAKERLWSASQRREP
jgi:hypothetical protein